MDKNIYLFGEITSKMIGKIISDINEKTIDFRCINIYICTEGGDLYAAFALISYILVESIGVYSLNDPIEGSSFNISRKYKPTNNINSNTAI